MLLHYVVVERHQQRQGGKPETVSLTAAIPQAHQLFLTEQTPRGIFLPTDDMFLAEHFLPACFLDLFLPPAAVAGVITGDIFPPRLVFRRQPLLYLKPAVRHVPKAHIEQ